jgi:hypothetical protein
MKKHHEVALFCPTAAALLEKPPGISAAPGQDGRISGEEPFYMLICILNAKIHNYYSWSKKFQPGKVEQSSKLRLAEFSG